MYSEELEELIEAILADEEITEKERRVLHKRAIAEGVDPDEIDIIIEGRLTKRKKESRMSQTPPPLPESVPSSTASKSNKHGEIRKCPHCGAIVVAAEVKCRECGYDFIGIKANSTRERLFEIIEEIKRRHVNKKKPSFFSLAMDFEKSEDDEIADAIKNIPVPATREDLLEFLTFLEPLANVRFLSNGYEPELTPAYKAKYRECCNKAQIFFSDDPLFISFFEGKGKKDKKKGFFRK